METLNAQRQLLCSQVMAGAEAQIQRHPELLAEPVLIVGHETWPANVVGIVASRLVEQFGHPAVVLSMPPGEVVRGSARSVPGVDIGAAIATHRQDLISCGGHPMAAGLSIAPEKLPAFRHALSDTVARMLAVAPLPPAVQVDAYLDWEEPSLDLAREVARLAPFGAGNPPLCFASRGLRVVRSSVLGRTGEHRRLIVADEDDHRRPVLWWHGADGQVPDEAFDLAYTLRTSDFRGSAEVQVEWLAARPADQTSPLATQGPSPARMVDCRHAENAAAILRGLLQAEPSLQVWAEVKPPPGIAAKSRLQLSPAATLAVWTTPPSRRDWDSALAAVQATTVYLFGHDPGTDDLTAFAQRLAGLVKYGLRTKGGYANLAKMAAAMGQREETVGLGLRWLAARRQVDVRAEDGRGMTLAAVALDEGTGAGQGPTEPEATLLAARIRDQLAETAAYRKHWLGMHLP
jgi:single-stranded-DNA-specific exonuclease